MDLFEIHRPALPSLDNYLEFIDTAVFSHRSIADAGILTPGYIELYYNVYNVLSKLTTWQQDVNRTKFVVERVLAESIILKDMGPNDI